MIDRREILEAASGFALLPSIVEKDYVLGWMLAGINAHDELDETWVFKGGTCLKKCYFETYRFSEDLDFTLRNDEQLDEEFLRTAFEEVIAWVTEQSGLNIPADQLEFDIYDNSRGRPNCQGKIAYRGPVSPTSGGWPKIKLDLTADERLVLPSIRREVFHPYSDRPEEGIWANCYAYEEAFGEKLRALGERTRPRGFCDFEARLRLIPSGHQPDNSKWRPTSVCMRVLRLREIAPSILARGEVIDAPTSFHVRSLHELAL
jgi:predicted nucleotidyltransferase component of viral defense system